MDNLDLKKISVFFQKNLIFILLLGTIILLEFFGFNHRFFVNNLFLLEERELRIQDGTLYGFELAGNTLVSEHNDPNLTFRNIDTQVRYINLQCTNPNEAAFSQIYYRRVDEDFIEENSILFALIHSENIVSLPRTIKVTSLRFDLTNKPNDAVVCDGITINPFTPFRFSLFRFLLLIISILGLIFSDKVLSPKLSQGIWNALLSNGLWFFAFLLILIGTAYPVTITFDSAHFLWLADHIRTGNWASWDPIRSIGYPMHLHLSNSIFGYQQNALLIPMILSLVLLYIFSCQIAVILLKPKKEQQRFLLYLLIFLIIGLDPTIVGYFHVLLTEYLAATIAMISCYMALKLYQSELPSKRFYIISTYFLLFVPVSWHLKQPYIGAAYFPFFLACVLMVLRNFNVKVILHGLLINIMILTLVFSSAIIWDNFLENQGNLMEADRQFSSVAETRIDRRVTQFRDNPSRMIRNYSIQYLASTNYLTRTAVGEYGEASLTSGFQNRLIAQRMFLNPGSSNKLYEFTRYDPYTRPYHVFYSPPNWLNGFFQSRIVLSNFFFTTSYLALPILLPVFGILWVRKKNLLHSGLIILGGTSFLNAIAHLLGSPIDRYLFMGYPLNLLLIIIGLVKGIRIVKNKLDKNMVVNKPDRTAS